MSNAIFNAVTSTKNYLQVLYDYIIVNRTYNESSVFDDDIRAKIQLFSLALTFKMWFKPHYRSNSFQDDLINNLPNVAIPGSGIPLSIFCYNYWLAIIFIVIGNPTICLLGALNKSRKLKRFHINQILQDYIDHLLHPSDWFTFWQMNCRLTSYASLITNHKHFQYENKWLFITEGLKLHIPVSPILDIKSLVCKNINIEGGLGITFYKNAMHGGEYIIQERLNNADWLQEMLPTNGPLSTMRIITSSTWLCETSHHSPAVVTSLESSIRSAFLLNQNHALSTEEQREREKYISPLSATLRLGRAQATTDHNSVLFDVDLATGTVGPGLSNMHWYQVGVRRAMCCPWLPPENVTAHPDPPGAAISGVIIPDMKEAIDIVCRAHYAMMPAVPIAGWDVAFTTEGIFLLEANLSCNFFRGSFDVPSYVQFIDRYWTYLSNLEAKKEMKSKSSTE